MADDDVSPFGKLKSKLVDSKQKWAEDGRLLTGKTAAHARRLPPGQRKVENWPCGPPGSYFPKKGSYPGPPPGSNGPGRRRQGCAAFGS
jgi:hypothetical protein